MKKHILILGGGILQVPLLRAAHSLNLKTTVFDMNPGCPAAPLADFFFPVDISDESACSHLAEKLHRIRTFHGVVTAGTDRSTTVARIARDLGLPGIDPEDALAASDKYLMRKRLREHGVPVPEFACVIHFEGCEEEAKRIGYPVVVKPVRNMGARGVSLVRRKERLQEAFQLARSQDRDGRVIVEAYMEGPELSVDALSWMGKIQMTGIGDRIITGEPYFIETGHNMPSSLNPEILGEAARVMEMGMRALGIHTGAGKGDLKVTRDGVMVGEIAARLSGGFMSSHTFPLHSAIHLHRAAIQIALGEVPQKLDPLQNLVAIERCICSPPGVIKSIQGKEEALQIPNVEAIFFTKGPGDLIREATSNVEKVGHIIAVGSSLEDAESSARMARESIRVTLSGNDARELARTNLGSMCRVCPVCDGKKCSSSIPGMGGAGTGAAFYRNYRDLEDLPIVPRFIRQPVSGSTEIEFFGRRYNSPVMVAPMTGVHTNMNGFTTEENFVAMVAEACQETGTLYWSGDPAGPEGFQAIMKTLTKLKAPFGAVLKPRRDGQAIIDRMRRAEDAGCVTLGIDLDSIELATMVRKGQPTSTRDVEGWSRILSMTKLPVLAKGILDPEELPLLREAGFAGVIVSNHGGRTLDSAPSSASVLGTFPRSQSGFPVLADGGVRSGESVYKLLNLGASAVMVGRPVVIAIAGGGTSNLVAYLEQLTSDTLRTFKLTGYELQ